MISDAPGVGDWRTSCQKALAMPTYARLRCCCAASSRSAGPRLVAEATTSLPEPLEADRHHDYRYAQIGDQCYAALALAAHGRIRWQEAPSVSPARRRFTALGRSRRLATDAG